MTERREIPFAGCFARLWTRMMPLRFLVVGGWNFIFGYLAFVGCYWLMSPAFPDWIIVVISSVLGITNSFVFHRWLTYKSHGNWFIEYLRFYVVYGGQVLLTMSFIHIFVTTLKYNAYVVSLVINVVLTVLSYWAHKMFSFREEKLAIESVHD